jgi:hypothetical protein
MPIVRRGSKFRGMGIYPGQPCYDPSRSAWVPYWLATPSEAGCALGLYPTVSTLGPVAAPVVNPAPSAPTEEQLQSQLTGGTDTTGSSFTPAQATAGASANYQQSVQDFFNNLASQQAYGGTGTQPGPSSGTCDSTQVSWFNPATWCTQQWVIAVLAGVIGGELLFGGLMLGGRR